MYLNNNGIGKWGGGVYLVVALYLTVDLAGVKLVYIHLFTCSHLWEVGDNTIL